MKIVLVTEDQYAELWKNTMPQFRVLCDLPCRHMIRVDQGTLIVVREDVEIKEFPSDVSPSDTTQAKFWGFVRSGVSNG